MKRARLKGGAWVWPVSLLVLAGIGPILFARIWPTVVGREIQLAHKSKAAATPDIEFKDGQGQAMRLSNFKGRFVLLNVWATWCAPCREEMPSLDRLQVKLGGAEFQVVALSIDRAGVSAVERFFGALDLRNLKRYIDESAMAMGKLGIIGVPTTLLIDREGREVWRYPGAAEWDKAEMIQVIRKAIGAQER